MRVIEKDGWPSSYELIVFLNARKAVTELGGKPDTGFQSFLQFFLDFDRGLLDARPIEDQVKDILEARSDQAVNHPSHYGGADNAYEAIKVIEAWELGFALGNAVKYISRAGKKPGSDRLQDLKKARWYLDREIANASQ